jgi:hypothetical protein
MQTIYKKYVHSKRKEVKKRDEIIFVSIRYKMIRIVCFCLQWTDRHTHTCKKRHSEDMNRTVCLSI